MNTFDTTTEIQEKQIIAITQSNFTRNAENTLFRFCLNNKLAQKNCFMKC